MNCFYSSQSDFNFRVNVAGIERGKGFGSPATLLSSAVFTVPFSAVRFNLGVTKTLHIMREKEVHDNVTSLLSSKQNKNVTSLLP